MTVLELSLFVIDYLSTVPLWNQGSKCNSVSPIEPLACMLKHIGIGPLHFQILQSAGIEFHTERVFSAITASLERNIAISHT